MGIVAVIGSDRGTRFKSLFLVQLLSVRVSDAALWNWTVQFPQAHPLGSFLGLESAKVVVVTAVAFMNQVRGASHRDFLHG